MARNELYGLPDFEEFAARDLKVLEECTWEQMAYNVWHDTVKRNDPNNAQKWTGMITARLLKSIADDSRAIAKLTWVLVGLTLLLFVDILVRLIH